MTLYISYSGLLNALHRDEVTEGNLSSQTSLFFFGCSREHALSPGSQGEFDELKFKFGGDPDEEAKRATLHGKLTRPLLQAEEEGRVAWRKDRDTSRTVLVEFLARHGIVATLREGEGYPGLEQDLEGHCRVHWR